MKNRSIRGNRASIVLLFLIVGVMYAFVPRPKADPCGASWFGYLTAGSVTWVNNPSPGVTNVPPTLSTNCPSGILVDGYAEIVGICGSNATYSVDIQPNGTQAIVDTTNNNGHIAYWVHDPKQIGQILCKISLGGSVSNCASGDCMPWTVEVKGSINVTPCGGCGCGGGGTSPPGSCSADNNSIDFTVNFGATSPQVSYGRLWLKEDAATANLADPALLQVPYDDPNVETIKNLSGVIEQINTPQMLINVSVLNSYEYHLECFYATNVTAKVGGLYGTNASAFVYYVIKNPDGASAYNRLWITETRGSSTKQYQYTYTSANMQWDLLEPTGETLSTWRIPDTSNVNITNYYRQIAVGSQIFTKDVQTFKYVPATGQKLLLSNTNGFGSVIQVTAYSYYTNGPASNRLQEIVYPEGNWFYYTYDSLARTVKEYSAFGNSSAPTPGIEPNATNIYCRMTVYDYTLTNTIDGINDSGDPYNPWAERKVTVYLPGGGDMHEVSRSYRWTTTTPGVGLVSEEQEQCPEPGAHYGDAGNIKTTTYFMSGTGFADGKPSWITHPDGSFTSFSYPDALTTIEDAPDGSTTTSVVDSFGNLQSRSKTDDSTGVILSRMIYCYTNSGGTLYDQLMRTHDEIDLAGRTNHYEYDCCTLESVMNPDGVQTSYAYDGMKRLVTTTVYYGLGPGITTSNTLDAAGRVLAIARFGTNSSIAPIVMKQYAYDAVGRVIAETNALNGGTSTTNLLIGGQLCVTNVNPDGGTRIEMHCLDGTIQYIKGTAEFGVQYTNAIEQDPNNGDWRRVLTETKLDSNGGPTTEWTKSFLDGTGRGYLTLFAATSGPYPSEQSFYNSYGELWKTVDADDNITFRIYDDTDSDINHGQLMYTIKAMSGTTRAITDYGVLVGSITSIEGDIDRITKQQRSVVQGGGGVPDVVENSTYQWTNNETDGTGTLISSNAISTTGLTNWMARYANASTFVTSQSRIQYSSMGHSAVSLSSDGSYTTNWYSYGRLASATKFDATPTQLGQTTYSYDAQGRMCQTTDARNGTTTYNYNNADQVSSTTTPNPGSGGSAQTTTTYCNSMLQVTSTVQPDGTSVSNIYYPNGLLALMYGSRTYPVAYSYDYAGRMKTMTNWSSFPSGGQRVTTWNYDGYRGFLTNKAYDITNGPSYTYTPGGRLQTRLWRRGIKTTYNYDYAGGLTNVSYNDGVTSAVTNTYDRLGKVIQVGSSNQVCQYQFDLAGDLLVETNTSGLLAGLAVMNVYDQNLRRTNLNTLGSGILSQTIYTYTNDSRLSTVSDGTNNATYSYVANSPLVSQTMFKSNSVVIMTTIKQYDYLNRLTLISNAPSASAAVSFNYNYNSANQRSQDKLVDGSYWMYQYDALGQVTSGKKYWLDGTPMAGQQFEYTFDDIGNRTQTKTGGNETGANLRLANYTNNALNQITSRDVPSYVDVMGIALATNSVTVDGQTAYRKGEYFRYELQVGNGTAAVWTNIAVTSPGQASTGGYKYVSKTAEIFSYDADGNLTNDGRWTYVWDAENRLITMTVNTNVGPQYLLRFVYDLSNRRLQKTVFTNGVGFYTNKYLYDGWNLIAELTPSSDRVRSYMWGNDLSGGMQRAGGIGGLLEVGYFDAITSKYFLGYDGNGNVACAVDAGTGVVAAEFEYAPFGENLRASGEMARNLPFRFATKFQDIESDLIFYQNRYLNSSVGKWLSRDPIADLGFQDFGNWADFQPLDLEQEANEYLFVRNEAISRYDILGLQDSDCPPVKVTSGSGTLSGGIGQAFLHHPVPGWHRKSPPVTDTFTISCPSSDPYLATWGLTSSGYSPESPDHPFPNGWDGGPPSGGPGTYTVVITVASYPVYTQDPDLSHLQIVGTCTCKASSIKRDNPPAPPNRPPKWPPPYPGMGSW